jgi:hypothetical protein
MCTLTFISCPTAFKMQVEAAPNPNEIYWRNVGLPSKARRTGVLTSLAATVTLCLFWSIPMAFLSSLTEVNSLKTKMPALGDLIVHNPWLESFLALIAPLLVLLLNETVLPTILKWFATWEGHIASPALDTSVFVKLSAFTVSVFRRFTQLQAAAKQLLTHSSFPLSVIRLSKPSSFPLFLVRFLQN